MRTSRLHTVRVRCRRQPSLNECEKLAAEIVQGKSAPKDQAQALYEWVAKNITYGGNCIGIGAVVPRDLAFVLDNKMGDCKDHATLLQALLAARGISGTQALVNAGSVYGFPKVPVVSMVNHVINYLPAFDLSLTPRRIRPRLACCLSRTRTNRCCWSKDSRPGEDPGFTIGSNRQRTKSIVKIAQNGSVSGSVKVFQKGDSAVQTRASARTMSKDWEAKFVKNMFFGRAWSVAASSTRMTPPRSPMFYHYKADLSVEKFVKLPGSGAFYVYPLLGSAGSVRDFLNYSMEPEKEAEVTCTSGALTEDYGIVLPRTMKVLSIPDDLKIANDFLAYDAVYSLKDNVLTVKRGIDDRTRGDICSPQILAQYKDIGEKVMDDLKSQVLYK